MGTSALRLCIFAAECEVAGMKVGTSESEAVLLHQVGSLQVIVLVVLRNLYTRMIVVVCVKL